MSRAPRPAGVARSLRSASDIAKVAYLLVTHSPGQNQDTANELYDFLFRELHNTQGRARPSSHSKLQVGERFKWDSGAS